MAPDNREYRILSCTESPEDGARIKAVLAQDGLSTEDCTAWTGLPEERAATVGVIIFGPGSTKAPPFYDVSTGAGAQADRLVPIILLPVASEQEDSARLIEALRSRPHVTVLRWPVEDSELMAAVRSAIHTRRLQWQFRELRDQYRILTEHAPVAFGIVQGTRIVFANRFFAEWSGYSVDELESMDFTSLVHPGFRDMMLDRARRRQAGEAVPDHYEFLALTKNGEERWFDFSPALIEFHGKPAVIGAGLDITQRKRAEQALQKSEARMGLLSRTATRFMHATRPDEVLGSTFEEVADHLGAEVFVNYLVTPDGDRLHLHSWRGLDFSAAKAIEFVDIGQSHCGRVARDRQPIFRSKLQESVEPDDATLRSLGFRAYACHPLQDHKIIGTVAFCSRTRDEFTDEEVELMRLVADQASMVLARQRLTAALEQRAAALDEVSHAKDRFLAVLSHELRTPLTPVLALISMLRRKGNLEPSLQRDIEMIRRNIELEARLIDDLLDLNRIERGKIELQKELVDICTILHQVVEVCRPELESRRLHFETNFGDVTGLVEADAARLQQVFWNLLKNAIKFTPPDGCVGIRCSSEGENVLVEVSDSGLGIEPEVLPRIFEPFVQADRNVTRDYGGLGLGLSICKSLVELHGGVIEARSEGKDKGSTFVVRLPLQARPAEPVAAASPARGSGTSPAQPMRILLAEDHRDTAEMFRLVLEHEGHEVEVADTVTSALKKASEQSFDLLISDLGLPDGSGLDLMRELRRRRKLLPGIALSGYGQEQDVQRSREAGFFAHLIKPTDVDQLLNTIRDAAHQPLPAII